MHTTDLIKALANRLNISQKQAHDLLQRYISMIGQNLTGGHRVILRGFGTFEVVQTKPRKMRHPSSGKTILVPSRKALHFRPSQNLKDEVQKWNPLP